ncbi:unnamed protein product, partial [marine sediment metagenome]
VTGARLDVAASTPSIGVGGVAGDASGYARQTSHNLGGGLYAGGLTGGIAGQESAGGFGGKADAAVILFWGGDAGFDASITQMGYSQTDTYKITGGGKGLGTSVYADTLVITTVGSYDNGIAHADVDGGFEASGAVHSGTVQSRNGGYASAEANGSYSGAGSLGNDYFGRASGYTETFAGDNGVMQAGAGMSVTSQNQAPPVQP